MFDFVFNLIRINKNLKPLVMKDLIMFVFYLVSRKSLVHPHLSIGSHCGPKCIEFEEENEPKPESS